MKSTHFDIDIKNFRSQSRVTIPTLSAYAIEHSTLYMEHGVPLTEGHDYILKDNELVLLGMVLDSNLNKNKKMRLIIDYHGIRDYRLLFPSIGDEKLGKRLGEYYRELESNFDIENWLSFALMCGAVFEGILFSRFGKGDFYNLIRKAREDDFITDDENIIIDSSRNFRNIIHGDKSEKPYIKRREAMDMRVTLDRVIKSIA